MAILLGCAICNILVWSADYGSFHKDLGCDNDQNSGAGVQKFRQMCHEKSSRCAKIYLSVPKIFKCGIIFQCLVITNCQRKR